MHSGLVNVILFYFILHSDNPYISAWFLTVEWSRHIINIFEFWLLPPWRRPHVWSKHVDGHYITQLHLQNQSAFLVF